MRLASKFGLPLVTLIDTPGPLISIDAETNGLGIEISNTMSLMSSLRTPSMSVIIGEGGNAAAIALGVADRVLMMENAIYSTISPEDAAEIIYQDEDRADEAAESLKLTADDCLELGIIDAIVPEPQGGAHNNADEAARQLRSALIRELSAMQPTSAKRRINERYKKFRRMGEYSSRFRAAIVRDVDALQGFVSRKMRRIARRNGPADESPQAVESSAGYDS
jgi:acetyl-CoA carboxylase carboxyl transferase subunit alpha